MRHLGDEEVGRRLERGQRRQAGRRPDPERAAAGEHVGAAERADLLHHPPHRHVVGAPPDVGAVAVDEEELVDAVGGGRQQVAAEAEHVAVAGVEAGDRPPAHRGHLVGDGEAGHGGPAEVVVGHEVGVGDLAEHADLVAGVDQRRPRRRLDLEDQLERHGATLGPAPTA